MTTIAISVENQKGLEAMKRGRESFDEVISRLKDNQFDVFVEFLLIDNELPSLHTAAFQCGTDTDSVFYFDGMHQPRQSTPEEINNLMKQSKPNITFSMEDAGILYLELLHCGAAALPIKNRLNEFLHTHPKKSSKK